MEQVELVFLCHNNKFYTLNLSSFDINFISKTEVTKLRSSVFRVVLPPLKMIQKLIILFYPLKGFPGGSVVKTLPASVGDMDLIPGSRRPPGEGNGIPLQYSCPGNLMDREAWRAAVHGVAKQLDTT